MPRRNNPEYELHKAVIEWLAWVKPDCLYFHPYNGAFMSKATAGKGKAMGVLPGVADLVFVLPGGKVGFIELKAPGNYLTPKQKAFRYDVLRLGALYAYAHSHEEVVTTLRTWVVSFHAQARGRAA